MKKQLVTISASILFLLPLYGYAEEAPSSVLGIATSTQEQKEVSSDTASTTLLKSFTTCSQEAIEARDTSIASSRMTYNTAMANALTERKNREKAGVAITDENDKKEALKASVDTYKHQAKAAQATLTQARKLAWQTFDNDIKACREVQSDESPSDVPVARSAMSEQASMMRKMEKSVEKIEEKETKTIKETIKAQFESLKSLFN